MRTAALRLDLINNEDGILTLDFLFAFVLVMGFSFLFFALSLTLTVVEVTQYITFAAARNSFAGNFSPEVQLAAGDAKFNELISHEIFQPFYKNGWFEVTSPPMIGLATDQIAGYQSGNGQSNRFFGVATNFTARILDFNVPFYGSTAPDGDGTGSAFNTIVGSYLGREVNTTECTNFTGNRWVGIRRLNVSGAAPYTTSTTDGGYYAYTDNGC